MDRQWDREVDVLVVGTGAAGLSAAVAAAGSGQRTLMVESTSKWGGTTTLSGGGLWMPNNPLMRRIGRDDSTEKALAYMDAVIGDVGPASSPERRLAFVQTAPRVVDYFARCGVRWSVAKNYPDYYPDRVGGVTGRGIEVAPFDTRQIGSWQKTARYDEALPIPAQTDDVWLLARAWSTPSGLVRGARVVGRTLAGVASGKHLRATGAGLTSSLLKIVLDQGTEILLNTPLVELVREGNEVVGAVIAEGAEPGTDGEGRRVTVRARRGVVLAAGGFAHNTAWREKYHGVPGYTSAAEGDTGSVIEIAESIGAQLALMDDAWWGASFVLPEDRYGFSVNERSMPHSIMVDSAGSRFVNESTSYIDVGHAILEHHKSVPTIPCWLIVDARHRRRYLNSATMTGTKALRAQGDMRSADSVEALAEKLDMNPRTLRATVDRFNDFCRRGEDRDFGRGRTSYDNYYGDPGVKPNPNLGSLEKGPFTAFAMVPGDLGTKGGVLTDEHARVLDTDGAVIEGLYGAGNTTASVMGRTYPGAGSTIGPAVVFGYLGARHAAQRVV